MAELETLEPKHPLGTLWRRLAQDRVTRWSMIFLIVIYLITPIAGFLAPYRFDASDRGMAYAPPTPIFILDHGRPVWPFVLRYERRFNPDTYGFGFYPDERTRYPLRFFVHGQRYSLLGIPTDLHLFGVPGPARIDLLGTDINGWDNFSRLLYGSQFSLWIGFLGLVISFPIALLFGAVSGFFGGATDFILMRFAEIVMSFPSFYLLISLAAFLPSGIPSTWRFGLVVCILALIGWAGMARVIRGIVLSLRDLEYVDAARALGASPLTIIIRHIIPQTASFVIVAATMNVPGYLLAESALSFLGLGIQLPDASWGNMLSEAQDLTNIQLRPWLLLGPGLMIFATILAFNLVGDKLRDILDPKSHGRRA